MLRRCDSIIDVLELVGMDSVSCRFTRSAALMVAPPKSAYRRRMPSCASSAAAGSRARDVETPVFRT